MEKQAEAKVVIDNNGNAANLFGNNDENLKYMDLNFMHIHHYPSELLLKLIQMSFETREHPGSYVNIEIVKYIYSIWDKSDNSDELSKWINTIKNHLIETANMNSDEYYDILENPKNPRYNQSKHYIYYTWWLYVYYPLIQDGEELILKLIDFAYLDDAQDMLMYGIYQMKPSRLNIFMKKFLIKLWDQYNELHNMGTRKLNPCFNIWSNGTGAWSQIIDILKKLYRAGYNLLENPELNKILCYELSDGKKSMLYMEITS